MTTTTTTTQIVLQQVRIYAHHGVLPQERKVGAWFVLDVQLDVDFSEAMRTDQLAATVSYADVFGLIKAEMATPSQLLEHVAGRIASAIFARFALVTRVYVKLVKENPPIGAECAGAGVVVDMCRP